MGLRENLIEIRDRYPAYLAKRAVDKSDHVYFLVEQAAPGQLISWLGEPSALRAEG